MRSSLTPILTAALLLLTACNGSSSATPGPTMTAGDAGMDAAAEAGPDAGEAGPAPILVMTDKGPVQGTSLGSSSVFYAIPFAAPPTGNLRWKPPAPHAAWTTPIAATAPGAECGQLDAITGTMFQTDSSEDCLTLDIWTPSVKVGSPAPVMLWIFGGSFVIGSAGMPDYDGQRLSEATGAVVVTINYRLGPMGFLALSTLQSEDPSHPSTGMYGIEDQRAAMAWTKTNIAAFGGDPKNVTIFGESAGGISVCNHMVSPPSKGLFDHAMIESGACALGVPATEAAAETQGDALVKALKCDEMAAAASLSCMRSKSLSDILLAMPVSALSFVSGGPSWQPIIDGLNVPDDPTTLFKAGAFAQVPTLLGTNTNEGTLFLALGTPITTDAGYEAIVDGLLPGKGAAVVAHYPSAMYGGPKGAAAASLTDGLFVCPARRVARAVAAAGVPTYRYHFTHVPTNALLPGLGAFHSSEIPFVFGNSTELEPNTPTAAEEPLAKTMMGYWGRMATSGDPNGAGATAWPKYDVTTEPDLVLDLQVSTETAYKKTDCDFWDMLLGL